MNKNIDDGEGGESADGARVQRACDACRSRKIRCDRGSPCSNCRSSRLNCVTTTAAQKPQRQRIHISDAYEKKIDRIEDRLSGIEHVLERLAARLSNVDISRDLAEPACQSKSRVSSGRSQSETNSGTPAPFEGETTLNRQSVFARELLEHAVGSTPSMEQNAAIKDALSSLQDMVTRQGQYTNSMPVSFAQPYFNRSLAEIDATKLEKPPWDMASEVLDKASVYPTMCFAVVFPFLSMKNMKGGLKETYDNLSEASVGSRLLLFGVLYNLFLEFASYPVLEPRVEAYRRHAQTSRTQMEIAMSQLDIYLTPSYENILALLIGSAYAIEMCKPSLCWILNANAAGLCQVLGYHRIQTMTNDTEEERNAKIHIFWFIYLMDKTLSLRLGRASVIQDWDMSLPYPVVDHDHERFSALVQMGNKGNSMLLYWIKVGQIQGKTYEQLFSPAAFCKSPEERAQTATELVAAMNQTWAERGEASVFDLFFVEGFRSPMHEAMLSYSFNNPGLPPDPNTINLPSGREQAKVVYTALVEHTHGTKPGPDGKDIKGAFADIGDIFYLADLVVHYSTCSLIQRAVSPDNVTFNQDCLESARAALIAHQRCHKQFNVQGNEDLWSGYVHWSILQAPFTPFIVIFCNAVLHCDPTDLNSLAEFTHSLESCRTVSEGADKLYKMCHLFLQVAKLYVDAKTKEASTTTTTGTTSTQSPPSSSPHSTTRAMRPSQTRSASTSSETPFVTMSSAGAPTNTIGQFDPYLSALGLMPNSTWPPSMSGFHPLNENAGMGSGASAQQQQNAFSASQGFDVAGVGAGLGGVGMGMGIPGAGNQNTLQDWYTGSRYLMNLMEEDIQMPDLGFQ
ncbi:hypothetical protein DM02DRAFT_614634 [Periconia macrospinosa]|uniref:Zn(2)-C6 fungal-type domain-containing protein n=1 Tax=Periconia macrospinosa TaxID=97972 RepID=A0A2V1DS55_9PLEO|nr:hypothetical protein DM02DRAFT_614634 [Periconia macrospinosa]